MGIMRWRWKIKKQTSYKYPVIQSDIGFWAFGRTINAHLVVLLVHFFYEIKWFMHQILIHVCISLDRHNDKYDLHPMYWFIWWYPAHNCAISQKKTFTILTNLLGCHHLVLPHRKSDDNEFEGRVSVSNISDPVSYFTVPSAEGNSILWPLSSWIDAISNRARNPGSHSLQWRHNERDAVSNHQTRDCLLNLLFRRRSKKASKLRVTGLC